jgi:hypothetical protein
MDLKGRADMEPQRRLGRTLNDRLLAAFTCVVLSAVSSCTPSLQDAQPKGESFESAIVLPSATNEMTGVQAEDEYIATNYPGWKIERQMLVQHDGRKHDVIVITGPNGETKEIYFDIANWFGKY